MKQKPDFEYEGIKILIRLVDKLGRRLKRMSEEAGVAGTPFFITGKELRGDRKFTRFKLLIEQG